MHHFLPISVGNDIVFHIPDTWVKEVGEQGEYAFISNDGSVFLTATFMGFDKSETPVLQDLLEEVTAGLAEIADVSNDVPFQEHFVAKHITLGNRNMLFAMVGGDTSEHSIVASLFFKTEDLDTFEKNRALMEQIIQAVEIKS